MNDPASTAAVSDADAGWAAVVADAAVLARLARYAADPTHATMLVGPVGRGTRAAGAVLAGEILAGQTDDPAQEERHRELARAERHPAVSFVERTGASVSADQAREVVRRASVSPVEGSRQVIVLTEMHLATVAVPALLKAIEEPPRSTFFVVLADEVTPELVTIASRCMRLDFPPVPATVIVERLTREGVGAEVAELAARSSGGDAERARLLAGDERLGVRRDFWASVPHRLDGSGARVGALVAEARDLVEEVLAPLAVSQAAEMATLVEEVEQTGGAKGRITEVEARHKREQRRIRADEMLGGLTVLVAAYRDAVAQGTDPARYVEAAEEVRTLCERLVFNPNEELALQALFARLPRLVG